MQKSMINQTESEHSHHPSGGSRVATIKSFAWHLFQMIVAMEIGMTLYHGVFVNLLAPASYKTVTVAYPLFDYWMMMIAMSLPMIGLMRYHKYGWRYCNGMTMAMLAPVILLTALVWVGLISLTTLKITGSIAMTLGMAIYMLFRYRPADHPTGIV